MLRGQIPPGPPPRLPHSRLPSVTSTPAAWESSPTLRCLEWRWPGGDRLSRGRHEVLENVVGRGAPHRQAVSVVELPVNTAVDAALARLRRCLPETVIRPPHPIQAVTGRTETQPVAAEEIRQQPGAGAAKRAM